jgi:pilus assembly protein Flp/PilA
MRTSNSSESGQGLVEYALIIVLIAIVVIVSVRALGPTINRIFTRIMYALQDPINYSGPPATVSSISVNAAADCNPITGACTNVRAAATVSLTDEEGNPITAEAHVQFTNSGSGSSVTQTGTGTINSGGLGNGTTGDSVEACVIAVTGHSLSGGGCSTDAY